MIRDWLESPWGDGFVWGVMVGGSLLLGSLLALAFIVGPLDFKAGLRWLGSLFVRKQR